MTNSFPTESNAVSGGYYMNNLLGIAQYLESNGFSQAAAAGIAGTIAGESSGNPESQGSGGAGLIAWTPPSSASPDSNILTGNAQQDFDTQLTDLLAYANSNSAEAVARGGVDLSTLKAASSPVQAASWWSAFEGPLVPGSDIRTGVVNSIYSDLNGYSPNAGYTNTNAQLDSSLTAGTGSGDCVGITLPVIGCVGLSTGGLFSDVEQILERAGLFILGGIFVIMGLYILVKDTGNGSSGSSGAAAQQASQSAAPEAEEAAAAA
jgi:hypothetical protein